MSAATDLFHRKAFGKLRGGYFAGWKVSGDILRVGASTVKNCRFEWSDIPGDKTRTARTRSYKLAPPDDDSAYGGFLLQSWMWNRDTVFAIRNLEDHVDGQILDAMRNNPNLLLDSDDLTRDGFESAVSEESVVCRARFVNGYPHLDVPSNMGNTHSLNVLGCFGRVLLNMDDGYEAVGFEIWPQEVAFGAWLPAALAADGPLPAGKIPPHAVDADWPNINETRGGGPEINGENLEKFASPHAIYAYEFRRPNRAYNEFVRLHRDLYARPLHGALCFDRDALLRIPQLNRVTKAELRLADRSDWLDGKFLLPAINGIFNITLQPEWIIGQQVIAVAPALTVDAKWALGVGGYFNLPCCVTDVRGKLLACPPVSASYKTSLSCRLFVSKPARKVELAHHVLQRSLLELYPSYKAPDPFQLELNWPIDWWMALVAHANIPTRTCDFDSSIVEVLLTAQYLEHFLGATMLQLVNRKSLKAPHFLMVQPNMGKRPRQERSQPVGSVRFYLKTGRVRLKLSIATVKGTTVKGSIAQPYPDNDPPDGSHWVYSPSERDWVPNTANAGTVADLRHLYPALVEFAAHVVN